MTGRSTPCNKENKETVEDTGTVENNFQIRRRGDPSDAPMMQKSGVRSTVPMGMIWKSVKLFWTAKECCHQQRRHLKIPTGESIAKRLPMKMRILQKSTWSLEAACQSSPRHRGRSSSARSAWPRKLSQEDGLGGPTIISHLDQKITLTQRYLRGTCHSSSRF
jgi:hypothetical protein